MSRDQLVAVAYVLAFVLMFVVGMLAEVLRRAIVGQRKHSLDIIRDYYTLRR